MSQKDIIGLLEFFNELKTDEKNKIYLTENESNFFTIINCIFLNKNIIHEKLYIEDKIISLNQEEEENISKDLSCILLLALLILDSNFTDFSFSLDFILKINGFRKNENIEVYEKVIISKILLSLIDYYKGLDEFFNNYNETKTKIEEIKKNNNNDLINNITAFNNKFGLNIKDIKSKNIKEIYIEILKSLINKNNNNNNISFEIIGQLHLNSLLNTINNKKINQILIEALYNLTEEKINNSISNSGEDNIKSSMPTLGSSSNTDIKTLIIQKISIIDMNKNGKNLKNTVEFIKQIGQFYIFGFNNSLYIYDEVTKNKKSIKKKWIYNILNAKEHNEEKIEISICTKKSIESFRYEKGEIRYSRVIFKNLNSLFLMRRGNLNEYYICTTDNVFLGIDENDEKTYKIFDEENFLTKSGIKINENLMAFKSNKVASKGKDKIKLYNYKNKTKSEILSNDEEYSFIFSANGLEIMDIDNKNKVLLCACKKYVKNQKNGILVVNFEGKNINHFFHETNNFEVYCFCPIFLNKGDNILDENPKNMTNYFFAGGFDPKKKQGVIKIYRLIINENKFCNKIEYIQDCIFENIIKNNKENNKENSKENNKENNKENKKEYKIGYKNFSPKGPISCITQSNNEEKIIAGCWDGLIYSMDFDKIIYFLIKLEKLSNSFKIFFHKK